MLYVEIAIVVVLICVNGLLSMSELAIVSSRPARLKAMIDRGINGAGRALELGSNPGKFLSSVQIGITLVGVLSGAFSGATLGERLAQFLASTGIRETVADPLGVGIVVAIITYFSLIVGELVPKQIALRDPERVAARVAPAMTILATVSAPLVFLLDFSGRTILWLLGQRGESEEKVTDEEIKMLVAEAEHHGTIESDERRMIAGVMRLGDRAVRAVMTPRTEVDWINLQSDEAAIRKLLMETQHSRLPAGDGGVDVMVGVVQTRDVLAALLAGRVLDPRRHVRAAPIVYDQADALDVLQKLKESDVPMALVHDEYGHFEGIVTPADILEAITGVFRADTDAGDEENAVKREDGSWLLAGYMQADEMADILGIDLPENRDYETVAGYVLSHMHHLPATGECVDAQGWRFEVVDLDGRRIDKLIATRLPGAHREAVR
ncbi:MULTISPECIES: hemolysin family protein [unclassified Mesorhizobium]|uniref:hemolysin family protein n=6 Tax=Mesorhizobium TaxID=68287 RepID=UPI000FCC9803|nr:MULTISPECIES: hemolysin family protein [unclassified Mesorhizobium]RUU84004.1 HlyC/CorC family transporter [Mesorhizobium sp. M7A.T.Ca.TU.009.01.1.2]AZV20593.1 HlyC/CorC family transporter [Mesorhizobium sp. M7A.F.Ce.TU.012.03.2.1]RUT86506.1 HlyC/CorC family transporter [Mesorhizobium sp. M7A.T.Ca.US.000.02.1.1]RUT91702.1 HlyC/CorC family transporter [Mesorhizobium sp. M7A.T.Ca.US.000.02.2.1]RUU05396.1 HlyC/CorC family transporter [Mesorhizobium sp. M7A.T.Ca.TU.009.02.1.1]